MTSGLDAPGDAAARREHRRRRRHELRSRGAAERPHRPLAQVRDEHPDLLPDTRTSDRVRVSGRLTGLRRHGRLTFGTLSDRTGTLQLFLSAATADQAVREAFDALERDDLIAVEGTVMTTRRGELSVAVESVALLDPAPPTRADAPVPDVDTDASEAKASGADASVVAPPPDAVPPVAPVPRPPAERDRDPVAPRILAVLTAVTGLVQLLAVLPVVHTRMNRRGPAVDPFWVPVAGHVVAVVAGLLLLVLADQLRQRKRFAWRVAVLLYALGAVAHLLRGPQPVSLAFCVAMLAALAWFHHDFRAPGDPPSLLRLVRFVPTYLTAVLLFGTAALWTERARLTPDLTPGGVVETVVSGLVGLDGAYTYRSPVFDVFFPTTLGTLGIVGAVVLVTLLFRPLAARHPHTDDDWAHATRLVHTYGWDTLAYFALRGDKSFFFSRDGEAFLAYTYIGGHALVAGDPIGRGESVVAVLDEFLAMCEERAWIPALLAVREASMPLYASRGFSAFYLGDEAIIDCRRFSLEGPARKGLRGAVRRVGRTHTFAMIPESQADPALVGRLNAISARWRGKRPERGFTMSLSQDVVGAGTNPEFLLCTALDEHGAPGGFLRVVPAYGPAFGYTLDLMRHDPDAPNGMTEFLVASTAEALRGRGVTRLSMNFAMWGRLFADDVPFTARQRLARRAVGLLNPFFQIRSLRDFNARFGPEWLPRVLAYRRRADLPRIGLLYAGAEGFLSVPGLGELLVPKAVGGVGAPSAPPPGVPSRRAAVRP